MLLLLVLSCSPGPAAPPTERADTAPPSDDTAAPERSLDCTATTSAAVTLVLGVEWTPPAAGTSWVEFGETPDLPRRTPTTEGLPVHLDLVGLPADTDVYWRGITEVDGARWSCSGVGRTGPLPDEVPRMEVMVDAPGQHTAGYLVGAFFSTPADRATLVAYRRDGTPVWYHLGDDGGMVLDVHWARDGRGLLYNQFLRRMGTEDGTIRRVSLAGEALGHEDTPGAHHMFVELPDGTLVYQVLDGRVVVDPTTMIEKEWVGDAIAELVPGGEPVVRSSVWDWLEPTANAHMEGLSLYGGVDWTHGNTLKYDPETDVLLSSLAHSANVYTLSRATWTVADLYGPQGIEATPPFDYQHDPSLLPDGNLLMFMTEADTSGAIEYTFVDGVPTEVWRHGFVEDSPALGQAARLPNGNTFVNYGAAARMEEVTPAGEVVWEVASGSGGVPAQFFLVSDLYTGAP